MDDVIGPFATRLLDDLKTGGSEGWEYMKNFDQYYIRLARICSSSIYRVQVLVYPTSLSTDVVNW